MKGSLTLVHGFDHYFKNWQQPENICVCLFPPHIYMDRLSAMPFALGAQDCAPMAEGAYTGDVSAAMCRDVGASFGLVGHSERRTHHHESDTVIMEKAQCLQANGITPVICVGETQEQRENHQTFQVLKTQIQHVKNLHGPKILAYEPLWAIGTGHRADPLDIEEVLTFLSRETDPTIPLLYGGSVTAENIAVLIENTGIQGVLVGGASTLAESWDAILSQVTGALEKKMKKGA